MASTDLKPIGVLDTLDELRLSFNASIELVNGVSQFKTSTEDGTADIVANTVVANSFTGDLTGDLTGTADNSLALGGVSASSYLRNDQAGTLAGSLTVQNNLNVSGNSLRLTPTTGNFGLELGALARSNTPFIDFHSGPNNIDYDSRIIAREGGVLGGGILTADCSKFEASGDLSVAGDLIVNGTTTTVNSTVTTLSDPILTLSKDSTATDDGKDRGIEFKYGDGSSIKNGFFGWDNSDNKFKFIEDGTNTSEVFSGSLGDIQANVFDGTSANLQTLTASSSVSTPNSTVSNRLTVAGELELQAAIETAELVQSGTGTIQVKVRDNPIFHDTTNNTQNRTINLTGNSNGLTFKDYVLGTNKVVTCVVVQTNGATPFFTNNITIDGSSAGVDLRWIGGAPTSGTANSIQQYNITVIKVGGSNSFRVLASFAEYTA